jgi:hypothetical protein
MSDGEKPGKENEADKYGISDPFLRMLLLSDDAPLTVTQAQDAEEANRQEKRSISQIIADAEIMTIAEMADFIFEAMAKFRDAPPLPERPFIGAPADPAGYVVGLMKRFQVPKNLVVDNKILPTSYGDGELVLLTCNYIDETTRNNLAQTIGNKPSFVVTTAGHMNDLLGAVLERLEEPGEKIEELATS